jgi:hypothetical protein
VAELVVFVLMVLPSDLLLGDYDTADPDPPAVTAETGAPDPTAIDADGQRVYWEDLLPGMCVREDPNAIDYDYIVVDCSAEHEEEVTSTSKLAGKEWPGDAAVDDAADERCKSAFVSYVGLELGDSRLDFDYLTPEKEDWNHSRQTLICLVLDPDHDQITRALRGAHE